MAWTTPRTWTTGELVTAAIMNQHVRDQLVDLDTRVSASAFSVLDVQVDDTEQSTTDTSEVVTATWTFTPTGTVAVLWGYFRFKYASSVCRWGYEINSGGPIELIGTATPQATTYDDFPLRLVLTGLNAGVSNTVELYHRSHFADGRTAYTDDIFGIIFEE